MDLKIGLFGPDNLVNRVQEIVASSSNIELISFPFETPEDVDHLIDQAFMADVFLFLDPLAYFYNKRTIRQRRLPVVKVPKDEYALANVFYQLNNKHNQPLERLSIDITEKKYVENIFQDLKIDSESIYIHDYKSADNLSVDQVINFHRTLWEAQKIDYVITISKFIYDKLIAEGIPVYYVTTPKKSLHEAIDQARQLIHLSHHSMKRMISGYIKLMSKTSGNIIPQDISLAIYKLLKSYQKKVAASLVFNGSNQFTLVGTHSLLTYLTNHLRALPMMNDIENALPDDIVVQIGFGYGLTAKESAKNAQLALEKSIDTGENCCYIVNEREEAIGPIGIKQIFNKPKLYNELIHKARLNNQISYNFIQFITKRNNEPFSSEDVAKFYKVTKRSAERTIKKLSTANIINHVGEERPYVKGRPRKLFQLSGSVLQ